MSAAALDAAIDWMVLLCSGDATEDDHARLQDWLAGDPARRAAWQQVAGRLDASFAPIRDASQQHLARRTLLAQLPGSRRRLLRGALAVAAVGVGTAWVASRSALIPPLLADQRSAVTERRRIRLPDDSELVLNADSAVDIAYTPCNAACGCCAGPCWSRWPPIRRGPSWWRRPKGRCRPWHPLRRAPGNRSQPRRGPRAQHLPAHLRRSAGRAGAGPGTVVRRAAYRRGRTGRGAAAWADGLFLARDESLGDLVEAMRSYRRGRLRISPEAARLRVFGVYRLDDTDALLDSLAQTQPIRIDSHAGGWWVVIERQ